MFPDKDSLGNIILNFKEQFKSAKSLFPDKDSLGNIILYFKEHDLYFFKRMAGRLNQISLTSEFYLADNCFNWGPDLTATGKTFNFFVKEIHFFLFS